MTCQGIRLGTIARPVTLVALACGVLAGGASAHAETFLWSPANQNIVVQPQALTQTVAGVTVTAQAYTVEYTASTSTVFGPWPTGTGAGGLKIFGVDVRMLGGEQLGLISQPLPGIDVSGSDSGAGGATPGIDSFLYRVGDRTVDKLELVVFGFSQAIEVNSIIVDDVSNFERDVWVAECASAPDFAQGLTAALAPCTVVNSDDDITDGPFTHVVGLAGVHFLIVGARPAGMDLGQIAGAPFGGQFYIDSIDFTPAAGDSDGDGIADGEDNCPDDPNPDQTDSDGDGIGDACEPDSDGDGDGVVDEADNCPLDPNPDQTDADGDGIGDACEADSDGDGVIDDDDACPFDPDNDVDGDGICGNADACPFDPDNDVDGDGVCASLDNCPMVANPDQADADGDGVGDACEADSDGDGVIDDDDVCPFDPDNDADGDGICGDVDACPLDPDNDADGDGICGNVDVCPFDPDNDVDGDGVCGDLDNCPIDANADQLDTDGDGQGNACDADDDGDGVNDGADNCPLTPNPDQTDSDGDGQGDACDAADDDGDGVNNAEDKCPGTVPGDAVVLDQNSEDLGCSIAQLCPCDSPWMNHGAHVRCVAQTANDFVDLGLIRKAEKNAVVSAAARSSCGKKK